MVEKKDMHITPISALEYIQRWVNPGPVREWFLKNTPERAVNFETICRLAQGRGYSLDQKSGLLLRNPYGKLSSYLPYTIADIVFTRPSDLHQHKDVGEAIYVESGEGDLYLFSEHRQNFTGFCLDAKNAATRIGFIPVGIPHCFATNEDNPLEIRLACTGILKDENEITLKRFDKWDGARLVAEGL